MAVVNRWYRILELLVTQQRLTLEELRSDLNISLSTLQKSIEQLNELLDSDRKSNRKVSWSAWKSMIIGG